MINNYNNLSIRLLTPLLNQDLQAYGKSQQISCHNTWVSILNSRKPLPAQGYSSSRLACNGQTLFAALPLVKGPQAAAGDFHPKKVIFTSRPGLFRGKS